MNATQAKWKPDPANKPAEAGSSRVYYVRPGDRCWRSACWGQHGTRVYGFRAYGDGYDVDTNAKIADASEF